MMLKRTGYILACMALVSFAPLGWAKNVAMVVGIDDYPGKAQLNNAVKGAKEVATALTELGYEVSLLENPSYQELDTFIEHFSRVAARSERSVFYYAGHAFQRDNENWLVPSKVDPSEDEGVEMRPIFFGSEGASNLGLIILDACRDVVSEIRTRGRTGSNTRGLARQGGVENNVMVSFATRENDTAEDGIPGLHSPYTDSLLSHMGKNIDIRIMLGKVRDDVVKATNNRQRPFTYGSLGGDEVFLATEYPTAGQVQKPLMLATFTVRAENDLPTALKKPSPPKTLPRLPEVIPISRGAFVQGCTLENGCNSDELPAHDVRIDEFHIGKFEVTVAQWRYCHDEGGCSYMPPSARSMDDDQPITNVSWTDIQQYLNWISRKTGKKYRLPTESEWEYVARDGTSSAFPWGNRATRDRANYGKDDEFGPKAEGQDRWLESAPVGSFLALKNGVYDMHGNASEWVADCLHWNYRQAPTNGKAWTDASEENCNSKMVRGGSWWTPPQSITSTSRYFAPSHERSRYRGFRLAHD